VADKGVYGLWERLSSREAFYRGSANRGWPRQVGMQAKAAPTIKPTPEIFKFTDMHYQRESLHTFIRHISGGLNHF
jgi:hypothetical protein